MFSYIKGTIELIDNDYFVIENNGIGFTIFSSSNVTGKLTLHDSIKIYTYMNVREDDISLFGFLTNDEILIFKLLIGVSGIGPKGALAIMSTLTVDELRMAILSEDYKAISKANGVGPKTAQRVVIELKDKFHLEDVLDGFSDDNQVDISGNDIISETAMALTSLGYSNVEALRAIKKIPNSENMTVEELLKASLKIIM